MKYIESERVDIARQIYNRELSYKEAMEKYGLCRNSVKNYVRNYIKQNNLPPLAKGRPSGTFVVRKGMANEPPAKQEDLEKMTREELMQEVLKARIRETRLKKGYEVKGDGVVIKYDMQNTNPY